MNALHDSTTAIQHSPDVMDVVIEARSAAEESDSELWHIVPGRTDGRGALEVRLRASCCCVALS